MNAGMKNLGRCRVAHSHSLCSKEGERRLLTDLVDCDDPATLGNILPKSVTSVISQMRSDPAPAFIAGSLLATKLCTTPVCTGFLRRASLISNLTSKFSNFFEYEMPMNLGDGTKKFEL